MILRHPIYFCTLFTIVVAVLMVFTYGFYGAISLMYVFGIYFILIAISFLLYRYHVTGRLIIEYILLIGYFGFFSFAVKGEAGNDIYLHGENKPFSGKSTPFIIIFEVEGAPELPNNEFFNNKFYIPENGILLTSSKRETYSVKHAYSVLGDHDNLSNESKGWCACYGVSNHKFDYVSATVNPGPENEHDYVWENAIKDKICDALNSNEYATTLPSGYEDGDYLDQKEVFLRNRTLTKLPKGLSELNNLELLDLNTTYLRTIPEEVSNFKKLRKLDIGNNYINGLPEWIGTMDSLTHLVMEYDEFTHLPKTLLTLSNLEYLDIRNNPLDIAKSMETIKKLEEKGVVVVYE